MMSNALIRANYDCATLEFPFFEISLITSFYKKRNEYVLEKLFFMCNMTRGLEIGFGCCVACVFNVFNVNPRVTATGENEMGFSNWECVCLLFLKENSHSNWNVNKMRYKNRQAMKISPFPIRLLLLSSNSRVKWTKCWFVSGLCARHAMLRVCYAMAMLYAT